MSFIDKKEKIWDVKITKHGRDKISQGLYDPCFYRLYDDDIVYKSDFLESDSDMNRILNSVNISPATNYITSFNSNEEHLSGLRHSLGRYPLGTSSLGEKQYPKFDITSYTDNLSSYSSNRIDIDFSLLDFKCLIKKENNSNNRLTFPEEPARDNTGFDSLDNQVVSAPFSDDTQITMTHDELFIEINELNVDILNEQFDIEIYEVIVEDNQEFYKPIRFQQDATNIVDDLMISETLPFQNLSDSLVVSDLFEVRVDGEISDDVYCRYGVESRTRNIFFQEEINCGPKRDQELPDYSASNIKAPTKDECD